VKRILFLLIRKGKNESLILPWFLLKLRFQLLMQFYFEVKNFVVQKLLFFTLFLLISFGSNAQLTTLSQNFDVSCASSSGTAPSGWDVYNPITSTYPSGAWSCAPAGGRAGTPGMQCTGYYSGVFNLDTSYLITPMLNLRSYLPDTVYLRFDTKADSILLGGKLSVLKSDFTDSSFTLGDSDITDGVVQVFGNQDSLGWTTHQINLWSEENAGDFYLSFRYTSTNTKGSIWFLDNINTSTVSLFVPNISKDTNPLTVVGNSTPNQITLNLNLFYGGQYRIILYDIVGRTLYDEPVLAQAGNSYYTIKGLNLYEGMYYVKLANETMLNVERVLIR